MIKTLFSKWFGKKEEVTPPLNPSPLVVDILNWIRSLESCENAVKKYSFDINEGRQRETTTSYQISDDKRVIQIQKCVYGNKYDIYRDIFGHHCDLISKGYELYTLNSVEKKQGDDTITLPLSELFDIIKNDDNKPLLEEIYQNAERLYPTSDEYKKKLEEDKDREKRLKKAAEIIGNAFK